MSCDVQNKIELRTRKTTRMTTKMADKQEDVKTEKIAKIKENKFKCKACPKISPTAAGIKRHEGYCKFIVDKKKRKHKSKLVEEENDDGNDDEEQSANNETLIKKDARHVCKTCKKRFKFEKNYKLHIKQEHSKLPNSVKCPKCPVVCPNEQILEKHMITHRVYSCPHCNAQFNRQYHIVRHLEQRGCDGQGVRTYLCEICDSQFSRKDNLLVHLRSHIMGKTYQCKECNYQTGKYNRYVLHVSKHTGDKRFECDYCGKVTASRGAIAKHLEIHGDKKFECEVCGYSTYTIEVMRRHVLRHTEDKPFKCELCPASFIQATQLRRHLEKHMGNRCTVCQHKCNSRAALVVHMRGHEGLEQLLCPLLDCPYNKKPFAYEQSLQQHMEAHKSKEYSCEVCDKRFQSEVNMRRHMSVHQLERPRRCMYCVNARAYVRGNMLVRHVRSRHAAIFNEHLMHVRRVLNNTSTNQNRVSKSELDSILDLLDAVTERIMSQSDGGNVLYGGIVEAVPLEPRSDQAQEDSPLMSEEELATSINSMLTQLIDAKTLKCFGWPDESVDVVLEKVLEQCGQKPADRERWSRVQTLRENAKHLFLHVVEDDAIAKMLATHTIDQVVKHILNMTKSKEATENNTEDSEVDEADDTDQELEDIVTKAHNKAATPKSNGQKFANNASVKSNVPVVDYEQEYEITLEGEPIKKRKKNGIASENYIQIGQDLIDDDFNTALSGKNVMVQIVPCE